ncbi:MAG TPA: hypothetical protein VF857_00370, partial [Spirochaetota bacterium]
MNMLLVIILIMVLLIPLWVLFSSGGEKEKNIVEEDDRPLRRRSADRMIEEGETSPAPQQRRKDEGRAASLPQDEIVDVEDDFSLPFHPQEIIPTDSPFDIYRRTIANAETYMKRGDFLTARSLYEGVLDRVSDSSIRQKLEDNLDYLNNYHQVVSRRQELRRQKKDVKPQEIRLTLEGADSLAERLQIGISPEKPPIDVNDLVEKISEKLTSFSTPEAKETVDRSVEKYQDDLIEIKTQLRDVTSLKDQVRKLNEEQLNRDKAEIEKLKRELTEIRDITKTLGDQTKQEPPASITTKREEQILEDIARREDENQLLRDRLDLVQKELSMLKEDNSRAMALEAALTSSLVKKERDVEPPPVIQPSVLAEYDNAIESLKNEIASLKSNASSASKSTESLAQPLGDLAGAMKESMETLAPLLSESLKRATEPKTAPEEKKPEQKNAPEEKKPEQSKKDDFQLLEDMMNGPQFEEPTEDDILEKVLKDAVNEHAKKTEREKKKEEPAPEENPKPKNEQLKDDFELVSDYLKADEGTMPTDEDVMEKILKDAMKSKEFRRGSPENTHYENQQNAPRGFQPPTRKKKELPILHVSYNFSRLPDEFTLSIDKNHLEYSFYKFKPLLEKAADLVKRRKVKDAINYYRVVMDQDIP